MGGSSQAVLQAEEAAPSSVAPQRGASIAYFGTLTQGTWAAASALDVPNDQLLGEHDLRFADEARTIVVR